MIEDELFDGNDIPAALDGGNSSDPPACVFGCVIEALVARWEPSIPGLACVAVAGFVSAGV